MTTIEKTEFLIKGFKKFRDGDGKNLLNNPQNRIRFVITLQNHNATENFVKVETSEEIDLIIDNFTSELRLGVTDFFKEDARDVKTLGGYLFLQVLQIEIFPV
jgi:hypothetical protein